MTECLLRIIQNVKIAEFRWKVLKVEFEDCPREYFKVENSWATQILITIYAMFGILEFSLIWRHDTYFENDILILWWRDIVP